MINKKRILLIEPPFYRLYNPNYSNTKYPLSLGYLSEAIRKDTDWQVYVYNADFSPTSEDMKARYLSGEGFDRYLANLKDLTASIWQEIRSVILEYIPEVLGISAKSQNFIAACNVAKIAKQINRETLVIVGGPHPSLVGFEVLKCADIDVGVMGEGEVTIVELLQAIESHKPFTGIKGIFHRQDNKPLENAPRELLNDLDSLNFPHRSAAEVLIDHKLYPASAFRSIFATRGCPFNCRYCGSRYIWGRRVRFRSPLNVVAEIESLRKLGLKSIHFDDDTFGINQKYLNELCQALKKYSHGLKWSCEIHVKLVNDHNIGLMKEAGCYHISLGIESGSNEILNIERKGITIEEAIRACDIIKRYGIELATFFMVGFLNETEETLVATEKAMRTIKNASINYSIFTPYPGTEIFRLCKEKGLVSNTFDPSLYNHQSPQNCFCMIPPEKFREMASRIERFVDRRNYWNRIKRNLSLETIAKIRELGLVESIKKGLKRIAGR